MFCQRSFKVLSFILAQSTIFVKRGLIFPDLRGSASCSYIKQKTSPNGDAFCLRRERDLRTQCGRRTLFPVTLLSARYGKLLCNLRGSASCSYIKQKTSPNGDVFCLRRERDLNPRSVFGAYAISSRAPSTTRPSLQDAVFARLVKYITEGIFCQDKNRKKYKFSEKSVVCIKSSPIFASFFGFYRKKESLSS